MNITGRLLEVNETECVTDTFQKRTCVVEYIPKNPEYPEFLQFEFTQDRVLLLQNFQAGQQVTIHFDVRGRKWQPKDGGAVRYFVSLNAWRIEDATAAGAVQSAQTRQGAINQQQAQQVAAASHAPPAPFPGADDDDNLPF